MTTPSIEYRVVTHDDVIVGWQVEVPEGWTAFASVSGVPVIMKPDHQPLMLKAEAGEVRWALLNVEDWFVVYGWEYPEEKGE